MVRDITQIHQLENVRRDFVANVSHELRTPLTVIRGYLETLADSDSMPEQWRKPFSQMLYQSERMGQLMEDLISLSQLETKSNQQPQLAVKLVALLQSIRLDALELSGSKQQQIIMSFQQKVMQLRLEL